MLVQIVVNSSSALLFLSLRLVQAVAGKTVSASEVDVPSGAGYRETDHVKHL